VTNENKNQTANLVMAKSKCTERMHRKEIKYQMKLGEDFTKGRGVRKIME
jgi:uncharacterized membrane protein